MGASSTVTVSACFATRAYSTPNASVRELVYHWVLSGMAAIGLVYIVPVFAVMDTQYYRGWGMEVCMFFRFVETMTYASVSLAFAKTSCGQAPLSEVASAVGFLVASYMVLIVFRCFISEERGREGGARLPRRSTYGLDGIIGRAIDKE